MRAVPLILAVALLGGCDSNSHVSTYPEPGSYPLVAVSQLDTVQAGRYNTDAFVTSISECPPNMHCIIADHILIAGSSEPED
ncbi:MAG: hypothetical protein R3284_03245, partial [Rubricoccaceae bacterium]|nr:hypothetical protein [Rubricoccaceae bacterium]